MGTAGWQPNWWTQEQHESAWERAKEALKRDWEQTKVDLQGYGRDLNQGVEDTVKQATGSQAIPPIHQPNVKTLHDVTQPVWSDVEEPMRFGYGARQQYGTQHKQWDDTLEGTLKEQWESVKDGSHRAWNDVKSFVRRGYERATS